MKNLELLDVIALTTDLPDENLWCGQVGTIVEIYNNGEAYEVDFVDKDGHTYALLTLRPEQMMLLRYQSAEMIAA